MYRSFITPEPFTFSIWGVIYLLVAAALVYQLYLRYKKNEYPSSLDRFNFLFIMTSIFNILWNIFWEIKSKEDAIKIVRDLKAINNLNTLLTYTIGFMGLIIEKMSKSLLMIKIIFLLK